jgi:hypothetical protein
MRSLARAGTRGGTTGARGGVAPSISINMLITAMERASVMLTPRFSPSFKNFTKALLGSSERLMCKREIPVMASQMCNPNVDAASPWLPTYPKNDA